jgi:hypothetical protein
LNIPYTVAKLGAHYKGFMWHIETNQNTLGFDSADDQDAIYRGYEFGTGVLYRGKW